MVNNKRYDVLIVGGGPAGLNAALVLGRARKEVAVIDEGSPRNAVTQHAHGFLTRDGITPGEFRRIAQEEISAYPSVTFIQDKAVAAAGEDGDFQITTAQGAVYKGKKLFFAVGMADRPLNLPGLSEVYGKSAFVCPYCDGWELRDERLVVINQGPELMHFAPVLYGWSKKLTICTNGPDGLTEAQREELQQHGISLFDSPIAGIDSADGIVNQVVLEDGTSISCRGIFFKPDLVMGSQLPQEMGCTMTDEGIVAVDEYGKTSIQGIYCAGDAASRMHQAIAAAAKGALTAAAMNTELNTENWRSEG